MGVAAALSSRENRILLTGLTSLPDEVAVALSNHMGSLFLHRLSSLSDAAVESLAKNKGDSPRHANLLCAKWMFPDIITGLIAYMVDVRLVACPVGQRM